MFQIENTFKIVDFEGNLNNVFNNLLREKLISFFINKKQNKKWEGYRHPTHPSCPHSSWIAFVIQDSQAKKCFFGKMSGVFWHGYMICPYYVEHISMKIIKKDGLEIRAGRESVEISNATFHQANKYLEGTNF